jgi:hypothetical protein
MAPVRYNTLPVRNGHCVTFVRESSGAPHTSEWRRGPQVRRLPDTKLQAGLAISTFDTDRRYGNHTDGRSHAAILIACHDDGLLVWDQWGHPVAERIIRYREGKGDAVNDGEDGFLRPPSLAGLEVHRGTL